MKATRRLIQLGAEIDAQLHQFEAIDLKKRGGEDTPIGCCGSYSYAPTLYVSGRKDSKVFNLPKSGKAMIGYRLRSKSVNYQEDGTESYSTDIEVQTIEPKNFSAVIAKYTTELADGRARDRAGQYSAGDAPPRPEDIADAYGKKKKRAIGIGAGAAAVAAGAAFPGSRRGVAKIGGAALRTIAGLR